MTTVETIADNLLLATELKYESVINCNKFVKYVNVEYDTVNYRDLAAIASAIKLKYSRAGFEFVDVARFATLLSNGETKINTLKVERFLQGVKHPLIVIDNIDANIYRRYDVQILINNLYKKPIEGKQVVLMFDGCQAVLSDWGKYNGIGETVWTSFDWRDAENRADVEYYPLKNLRATYKDWLQDNLDDANITNDADDDLTSRDVLSIMRKLASLDNKIKRLEEQREELAKQLYASKI